MSLLQSLEMTEKNLAAHRRNARQSRGAATPNGKERSRAANLRHGSYSKLRNEALVALGEDPVQLAALIAGAHQQWRPANAHQAWMVEHLARLQWRIQRCERRQETVEAQHVKQVEERRRERTGQLHDDYANIEGVLRGILRDALRRDFYASPGYIQAFTRAFHGQLDRGLREILEVLHRLREPEDLPEVQEPLPEGATNDRDWKETREVNEAMAAGGAPAAARGSGGGGGGTRRVARRTAVLSRPGVDRAGRGLAAVFREKRPALHHGGARRVGGKL